MGGAHYRAELAKRYDGDVVVPDHKEQSIIGRIILDELVNGEVRDSSRKEMVDIVNAHADCDGVILGCTELCMILDQTHLDSGRFSTPQAFTRTPSALLRSETNLMGAFGLQTHIWNNNLKSVVLLLAGFPVLLLLLTYGLSVGFVAFTGDYRNVVDGLEQAAEHVVRISGRSRFWPPACGS